MAGVVFACAPYRVGALLGGHPAGLAYPLVPLALWGVEGALAGSLGGRRSWAGGALPGLAMMEPHFAYFAALGLPLYALARVGLPAWRRELLAIGAAALADRDRGRRRSRLGRLGALARQGWQAPLAVRLAVGAAVALLALAIWQVLAAWLLAAGSCRPAGRRAAEPRSRACPGSSSAPGGPAAGGCRGCLAVPLAPPRGVARRRLAALVVARLPVSRWLLAVGLAAGGFLLSCSAPPARSVSGAGRTLHEVLLFSPLPEDLFSRVNSPGRTLYPGAWRSPWPPSGPWRSPGGRRPAAPHVFVFGPLLVVASCRSAPRLTALPLFELGFRLLPSWHFIRQPAKFQVLVALALAVLAAVGGDASRPRVPRPRVAGALALGLLVAAEYHPWRPAGVSRLPGTARATRSAPGRRALYIPLWPGTAPLRALPLRTTLTRVPMLNGYSAWSTAVHHDVYRPMEASTSGSSATPRRRCSAGTGSVRSCSTRTPSR